MPDAPDVKLKISAEGDSEATAAIKELSASLKNLKTQGDATAETLSGNLKKGFEALGAAIAVEKIIEFGKEVFASGLAIARLAQQTGISTETLSVYTQAAKDAGGSVENMQSGIAKLATVIVQADQGNAKAAKSLALVGLSAKDFIGLNADQKLKLVTNALGAMPPGFQKVAAGQKLLGDGTGPLLQTLTALAGDGFAKASDEAERFGNILTTQAGKDLIAANAAMKDLEAAAEGAARQFETGMVPALTDVANAILNATSEKGGDGFKNLGQLGGDAIRGITAGVLSFGVTVGKVAAEMIETFDFAWNHIGSFAKSVWERTAIFLVHGLKAAQDFAKQGTGDAAIEDFKARIKAIEDDSEKQQHKVYDSLYGAKPATPDEGKPGVDPAIVNANALKEKIKAQEEADKLFAQEIANLKRNIADELTLEKAAGATREQEQKSAYERGIISLADYYKLRKAELTRAQREESQATAAELQLAEAAAARARSEQLGNERAAKSTKDAPTAAAFGQAAQKNATELAKANEDIVSLSNKQLVENEKNKREGGALDLETAKQKLALDQKVADVDKEILLLQGKTKEAADAELAVKVQEYRITLEQKFGAGDDVETRVAEYSRLLTASKEFNDQRTSGDEAFKALADDRAAIEQRIQSGQTFQLVGEEKIRQTELDRVPVLQAIADAMKKAADATGDAGQQQQATDFQTKVNELKTQASQVVGSINQIRQGAAGVAVSSLQNFLATGITGAKSMQDAFKGLADSVVTGLQQMAAQMLSTIIMKRLLDAIGKKFGMDDADPKTKVAAALAAGVAQSTPLNAAAVALAASGTTIATAGTTLLTTGTGLVASGASILTGATALGISAAALQVAADTLIIANSAGGGGGGGQAAGGLITGPGTSTSDSIPSRLSTGEFVVKASAVRDIGVAALHQINRGISPHAIAGVGGVPRFAEGGLVQAQRGAGDSAVHLHVSLDEGIVVKHLKSRAAGKVVVTHLADNPKAASKAIGRSA